MEYPEELRYSKEHEWVRLQDGVGEVGITDFAQDQLGDVVYLELPKVGATVAFMEKFGEIESVKAVSDLYSPLSGEMVERNERLIESPELVNKSPYGEGWMLRVRLADPSEMEKLMTAQEYQELIAQAGGG